MTLQIYGDRVSGNCLKVKWTADKLGIPHRWIQTDVRKGETRTPAFLAMNPAGQVPFVLLPDGRYERVVPKAEGTPQTSLRSQERMMTLARRAFAAAEQPPVSGPEIFPSSERRPQRRRRKRM